MNRLRSFGIMTASIALCTAAADSNRDVIKQEMARLQGEWTMAALERDGQEFPPAFVQSGKRVARGNEITVTMGGQTIMKATFSVNAAASPRTIDYTLTEGPDKGKQQHGIYELDGDTLRVCFTTPGRDRPTEFATKAGDERTLSRWKRDKP